MPAEGEMQNLIATNQGVLGILPRTPSVSPPLPIPDPKPEEVERGASSTHPALAGDR